jgi:hypothetical protein
VDVWGGKKCILRVEKKKTRPARLKVGQKQDAPMKEKTIIELSGQASMTCGQTLDQLLRLGAQQMLQQAIQNEVNVLFTFHDFPAQHWIHLRTTNPIESTFATVRHRTRQTKGCGSADATLAMVFQLVRVAEKHWRRLKGSELLAQVITGVKFVNGEPIMEKTKAD